MACNDARMSGFLLAWLATQAIAVLLVRMFAVGVGRRPPQLTATPRIAVIVAVKGHHAEFDHFLDHLFAQDYPSFHVIFTVDASDDPAVLPIEALSRKFPGGASVAVAELAQGEGQKIANLRAAIPQVTADDEIVVFTGPTQVRVLSRRPLA